jgi:endonuclease YncB( thermonuclease family)
LKAPEITLGIKGIIFFILFPGLCFAWEGIVTRVIDGDTVTVAHKGKTVKIMLYGIDTPERSQ